VEKFYRKLNKAFTNRKIVVFLFLALIVSLLISNLLPQNELQPESTAPWYGSHPRLTAAIKLLQLNSILTSSWFALLVILFLISLLLSTVEQWRLTRRLLSAAPSAPPAGAVPLALSAEAFQELMAERGFRRLSGSQAGTRFARARWGYWGNFLLHFGITVAVLFAFIRVVTEQRALLRLVEGVPTSGAAALIGNSSGLLGRGPSYPDALTLARITPQYWANDELKSLSGELVCDDRQGHGERVALEAYQRRTFHGQSFYLSPLYGNVFLLQFAAPGAAPFELPLFIARPLSREKAGYANLELEGGAYQLKAKYYADVARQTLLPVNPELVLRLMSGGRMVEEARLVTGGAVRLGPYQVRLSEVRNYGHLLIVGSLGTAGVFAGFFIILMGALMVYFVVPREVVLWKGDGKELVGWRSSRFGELYREEEQQLMALCQGEESK
jgi:hypothetical protein